jgi:hypothetical protein
MPDHYLVRCLRQFEEVSRAKYDGKSFNLEAIEKDVSALRTKRKIRVSDLDPFRKKDNWWFERYWVLPSSADVDPHLEHKSFDFHQLSKNNEDTPKERAVINDLLSAFRSIELVSIILRFIRPESFGILSPPVERVLDVRRGGDAVETYINYLRDLRKIRENIPGLLRAADADKALWVLHEKCFTSPLEDPSIKQEYEQDRFMLQLRAENLVAPLNGLPLPRLAVALETARNDLAGLVGCYAFEEGVRKRAKLRHLPLTKRDEHGKTKPIDLKEIIDTLHDCKAIDDITAGKWHMFRGIRNKVFHAEGAALTPAELRKLVQEVIEIDVSNRGNSRNTTGQD